MQLTSFLARIFPSLQATTTTSTKSGSKNFAETLSHYAPSFHSDSKNLSIPSNSEGLKEGGWPVSEKHPGVENLNFANSNLTTSPELQQVLQTLASMSDEQKSAVMSALGASDATNANGTIGANGMIGTYSTNVSELLSHLASVLQSLNIPIPQSAQLMAFQSSDAATSIAATPLNANPSAVANPGQSWLVLLQHLAAGLASAEPTTAHELSQQFGNSNPLLPSASVSKSRAQTTQVVASDNAQSASPGQDAQAMSPGDVAAQASPFAVELGDIISALQRNLASKTSSQLTTLTVDANSTTSSSISLDVSAPANVSNEQMQTLLAQIAIILGVQQSNVQATMSDISVHAASAGDIMGIEALNTDSAHTALAAGSKSHNKKISAQGNEASSAVANALSPRDAYTAASTAVENLLSQTPSTHNADPTSADLSAVAESATVQTPLQTEKQSDAATVNTPDSLSKNAPSLNYHSRAAAQRSTSFIAPSQTEEQRGSVLNMQTPAGSVDRINEQAPTTTSSAVPADTSSTVQTTNEISSVSSKTPISSVQAQQPNSNSNTTAQLRIVVDLSELQHRDQAGVKASTSASKAIDTIQKLTAVVEQLHSQGVETGSIHVELKTTDFQTEQPAGAADSTRLQAAGAQTPIVPMNSEAASVDELRGSRQSESVFHNTILKASANADNTLLFNNTDVPAFRPAQDKVPASLFESSSSPSLTPQASSAFVATEQTVLRPEQVLSDAQTIDSFLKSMQTSTLSSGEKKVVVGSKAADAVQSLRNNSSFDVPNSTSTIEQSDVKEAAVQNNNVSISSKATSSTPNGNVETHHDHNVKTYERSSKISGFAEALKHRVDVDLMPTPRSDANATNALTGAHEQKSDAVPAASQSALTSASAVSVSTTESVNRTSTLLNAAVEATQSSVNVSDLQNNVSMANTAAQAETTVASTVSPKRAPQGIRNTATPTHELMHTTDAVSSQPLNTREHAQAGMAQEVSAQIEQASSEIESTTADNTTPLTTSATMSRTALHESRPLDTVVQQNKAQSVLGAAHSALRAEGGVTAGRGSQTDSASPVLNRETVSTTDISNRSAGQSDSNNADTDANTSHSNEQQTLQAQVEHDHKRNADTEVQANSVGLPQPVLNHVQSGMTQGQQQAFGVLPLQNAGATRFAGDTAKETMTRVFRVPVDQFATNTTAIVRQLDAAQGGSARLILTPDALGTVVVNLSLQESHHSLSIEVSSDQAREAVQSQMPQLHEQLAAQGVRVDSVAVSVRQSESTMQNSTHQQQQSSQQRQDDREARATFLKSFEAQQRSSTDPEGRNRSGSQRQQRGTPRRLPKQAFELYA